MTPMHSTIKDMLWRKAAAIEPSPIPGWSSTSAGLVLSDRRFRGTERKPCQVLLEDRRLVDRVYLVDCRPHGRLFFDLNAPCVIDASRVVDLWPSDKRIPAKVVRKIASFGEMKMGCRAMFDLVMNTGLTLTWYPDHSSSQGEHDEVVNIDFPDLPSPFMAKDVVDAVDGYAGSPRIDHIAAHVVQVLAVA